MIFFGFTLLFSQADIHPHGQGPPCILFFSHQLLPLVSPLPNDNENDSLLATTKPTKKSHPKPIFSGNIDDSDVSDDVSDKMDEDTGDRMPAVEMKEGVHNRKVKREMASKEDILVEGVLSDDDDYRFDAATGLNQKIPLKEKAVSKKSSIIRLLTKTEDDLTLNSKKDNLNEALMNVDAPSTSGTNIVVENKCSPV